MPKGVRHLSPGTRINSELGRSHAWLPVTHTHTSQDGLTIGLWLHYMRGCSDMAWNVGRTLLAYNKCHAAVKVEMRAGQCTWSQALDRIARKLAPTVRRKAFWPALKAWYGGKTLGRDVLNHTDLVKMLHLCAHGRVLPDPSSDLVQTIQGAMAMEYVTAATIATELRGPAALDTIQIVNQCSSMEPGACGSDYHDSVVEIWDVRSLQYIRNFTELQQQSKWREGAREGNKAGALIRGTARREAGSLPRTPRVFCWLNGSECNLSPDWFFCLACANSESARSCAFKCVRQKPWSKHHEQYGPADVGCSDYGGRMPDARDDKWLKQLGDDANPLALALLWRLSWGPVLGSVEGIGAPGHNCSRL